LASGGVPGWDTGLDRIGLIRHSGGTVAEFSTLPTPRELFRLFETGEMSRADFQAAMASHQRDLIAEMEEGRRNPVAAYIEHRRNRAAARSLARRHGVSEIREVLAALGTLPRFPPAQLLWNAGHEDMPLHCFVRTRHEPVFRVLKAQIWPVFVRITVEYGKSGKGESTREEIALRRGRFGRLEPHYRRVLS